MLEKNKSKKSILIISTGGLIYDGITNVIISYLKAMDLSLFNIYIASPFKIDAQVRKTILQLNCKIINLPNRKSNTVFYIYKLIRFIRSNKISIIHAHGNSATLAIEMLAAWIGGCKMRIAHSHNTQCDQIKADKLLRPLFYHLYTVAFACGKDAGVWLFKNREFKVLQNGRDINYYQYNAKIRKKVRLQYDLNDEIAIGHVGAFVIQKNHQFLLQIFKEIKSIEPNSKFFLIGDGPLRSEIEKQARILGIRNDIIFTGNISNVPEMLQAMDGMLLPSLFEGVPLVSIEWQISGLPCIISDKVSKECICTNLVESLSLTQSATTWAELIIRKISNNNRLSSSMYAPKNVRNKGFDIQTNAKKLENIYLDEMGRSSYD